MAQPSMLRARQALLGALIAAVLAGCTAAESADAPDAERVVPRLEQGTRIVLRMNQALSTESNRPGDAFTAQVVEAVASAEGDPIVPAGSIAHGVIARAWESPSGDEYAGLELAIESVEISGTRRPISATVVQSDVRAERRDSGGETAAKIAVGTAAGALIGRAVGGDRQGALVGAGAGAVAGTAVAVTTDEGHARIDSGASLVIVLDDPFMVE